MASPHSVHSALCFGCFLQVVLLPKAETSRIRQTAAVQLDLVLRSPSSGSGLDFLLSFRCFKTSCFTVGFQQSHATPATILSGRLASSSPNFTSNRTAMPA